MAALETSADRASTSSESRSRLVAKRLVLRIVFAGVVFVGLWLTVTPPEGARGLQLLLGVAAMLAATLSHWAPGSGVLLAVAATTTAWALNLTADPFLLAGVGVFTSAERRGTRRFPWWLLVAGTLLMLVTFVFGVPPNLGGFEERMRGVLLGAVVLAVSWVLGVRTRQAQQVAEEQVRADERLRLARDVHDVLSHSLGAIGVRAGVTAHVDALGEPELREALRAIESQARDSLAELKLLLQRERDGKLETAAASLPLSGILRDVSATAKLAGLEVDLHYDSEVDQLPPSIRTTVHRVAQEAVTNALRHAGATRLTLTVTHTATDAVVAASDDGVGVSSGFAYGHGLTGMRERVRLLGGELCIDSGQPGFLLTARIPLPQHEGAAR